MYLSDTPDWLSTLVSTATTAYRDKKLIQAQADRIRAGQQPVALPPVGPTLTPLPQVQYDPASLQLPGALPVTLPAGFRLSPNTWLVAGGLAALGVGLLLLGRRRR